MTPELSPDSAMRFLKRSRTGDCAAVSVSEFEGLYPTICEQVRWFLLRHGAPTFVIDDLVSEVFVRAIDKQPECDAEGFVAWGRVVARNAFVDWYREQRRYADPAEAPPQFADDVADIVVRKNEHERLVAAIGELTATQQESLFNAVDDVRSAGRERAEIERLAAVRYRARANLRRKLADRDPSR